MATRDPRIEKIIERFPGEYLRGSGDPYLSILRAVVGQQISVAVASHITARIELRCTGKITAEKIVAMRSETLRKCGLSWRKVEYLQGIAKYFISVGNDPSYWSGRDFETVRAELMSLRGIGEWSFAMFAIFFLRRPDILPLSDAGLVRAMHTVYPSKPSSKVQLTSIAEVWKPWRTVATWYLWRGLDGEAIEY